MLVTVRHVEVGFNDSRLATYQSTVYARGETPLGFAEPIEERSVEYDPEVLRHFREHQ
jgi:hypothetical protein